MNAFALLCLAVLLLTGLVCFVKWDSDRMFWRTMRAFSSLTDDERRALLRAVSKMEG